MIKSWWARPWVRGLVIAAVSVAIGVIVLRVLGRIAWSSVGDALGQLVAWQVAALVAALIVRQALNAVSIKRFVPGLSLWQALKNDLSAIFVATFAPPPGDVVLRVSMFRSWGVSPVDGMGGVTLSLIVFYGARFVAPGLGLVLVAFDEYYDGNVGIAVACALIAATIFVAMFLVLRSQHWAALVGRSAARVVGKMKASVDPEDWAEAMVDFRGRMETTLRGNFLPAFLSTVGAVMMDGVILLLAIRFVGVGPETLSWAAIIGGYLLLYPLTIMPLFGLGILDAILIASWVAIAGDTFESALVAGAIVWRAVTIGGSLALGGLAIVAWRVGLKRRPAPHPPAQAIEP